MNPYASYYVNQVGSGLAGYSGIRYQRGGGFFGRLFSGIGNFVKELLPAAGKRILPSGIGLAQDVLAGENVLKSAKSRLIEAGKNVADETLEQIKFRLQKGSGRRRKRRKTMKHSLIPLVIKKRKVSKKVNKKGKKQRYLKFLQ
jgi:hypothetical protein